VFHFESNGVQAVEGAISANMQYAFMRDGAAVYDVEATSLGPVLDQIHVSALGGQDMERGMPALTKKPYTILIMNPDMTRINPPQDQLPEKPAKVYEYRYRYNGGSPTAAWIAQHRYLVADLNAGPVEYGVTNAGEGTVSLRSIPNLMDVASSPGANKQLSKNVQFVAQLSSLVVTAVRYVFVPDVRFNSIEYAEKVVIPLVVLRNHRRFNPIQQGGAVDSKDSQEAGPVNDFALNLDLLRDELSRMLLPHQQMVLSTTVQSLHEHRHVSIAVSKALQGDTVHSATPGGQYTAKTVPYLDSSLLHDELDHSVDLLVSVLTSEAEAGLPTQAATSATEANRGMDAASKSSDTSSKTVGHRVLPVYVLSLLGHAKELLLDHQYVHTVSKNKILVLQTAADAVFLPYFDETGILSASVRAPTRSVVAGIATVIGGLMFPFERYNVEKQHMENDYMWANGYVSCSKGFLLVSCLFIFLLHCIC
jgi:hypothetical protein